VVGHGRRLLFGTKTRTPTCVRVSGVYQLAQDVSSRLALDPSSSIKNLISSFSAVISPHAGPSIKVSRQGQGEA
jgi:hypothetical protein